ncbi:MAG: RNA polymerase sigma factor [Candidatus Pacebacteria bacterium]|nr:RNA polymerase sigma factor [Candidatus Paceibacterota bacterium]
MINHKDCGNKSDIDLVKEALIDADWFFCLSKRYEEKLLRYIQRISKFSREDTEDVLQEVLIKTYYNLNDFDPSLKFSSWIYRIAHNQTVSEIRKRVVRPTVYLEDKDLEGLKDLFDIEKEIDISYEKKKIEKALSLLSEKYREVLILRFLEEKEYLEIADILKKPVSTIGNLIARGKKLFKVEYEKLINEK